MELQEIPPPQRENRLLAAVIFFGSLLLMIVLGLGIGVVRQLSMRSAPAVASPTATPDLLVAGPAVRGGEIVRLDGVDWPPNVLVSVSLRDPAQPSQRLPIFSGQADARGVLTMIVTYPSDPRWADLPEVEIIVQTFDQSLEVVRRVPVNRVTASPTPTPTPTPPAPTDTPTATPSPTPQVFANWKGEYFNNPSLSGAPQVVRDDAAIDFAWGGASPDPAISPDDFSVRWTRVVDFPGGTQRFTVSVDDGVRVYIDEVLIIDEWHTGAGQTYTRDVNLGAGAHNLRVEMVEQRGQASIRFAYEPVITFTGWKGEYFANRDLSGAPALVRDDPALNFAWGGGSPDPRLPSDGFSARWTRSLDFAAGTFKFVVRADDGVRLFIDNVRVIDEWHVASPTTYTRDVNLAAGQHTLVIEYYENIGDASLAFSFQPATFTNWRGEYFANRDLSGEPVLVRDDAKLDFFWDNGAPASGLPADDFSARWARTLNFDPGVYRFSLIVDDGGRLYLDEVLMIDEWHDGSSTYSFTVSLSGGPHALRIEYYEHLGIARAGLSWARLADTPTPSATPSPSATPTPTWTLTPSFTPTPSTTPTPTTTS